MADVDIVARNMISDLVMNLNSAWIIPSGGNDTYFINLAISKLAAIGGGTLFFQTGATYNINPSFPGNTYFGIMLQPNVNLDGRGAILNLIGNTSTALIQSTSGPSTTITHDVAPGDTQLQVLSTSGFQVGMPVWYQLGESDDPAEPSYFGFASVLSLTPTTLQLDICFPRASNKSSVTNPANITVTGYPNLIQGISIKNFKLTSASTSIPVYAFHIVYGRNIQFKNIISNNPGIGVVYAQKTDNVSVRSITCDASPTNNQVPGRVISIAESTNFRIDNLRSRNRGSIVIYAEFYSQVLGSNIYIDNNSITDAMFYSNTGSFLDMENVNITGLGGFTFWVGSGDLTVRNLTLDLTASVSLPALGNIIKGRLSQRIAGGAWSRQNCDAAGAPSY